MRLTLGYGGSDIKSVLTRWGAEIRKWYFLTDEDHAPKNFSFDLSQLYSLSVVTFSNLSIHRARFSHVGNICHWELAFSVQGSADYTSIVFPLLGTGLPGVLTDGDGWEIAGYGRVMPYRNTVYGAVSLEVPPQVLYYQGGMLIRPGIRPAPGGVFYTNAGTVPTDFELRGFYFTKDFPVR